MLRRAGFLAGLPRNFRGRTARKRMRRCDVEHGLRSYRVPSEVLAPRCRPESFQLRTRHPFDPERLADVMARVSIRRTVKPEVRNVLFDGESVGRIGRCPFGPGWLASCSRSRLYWNRQDAVLALIESAGVLA